MTGSTASRASTPRSPPTARRGRSTTSPCPSGRGRPPPRWRRVLPRSAWRLPSNPPAAPDRTLDLPADLAFAGEAWSWVCDALPLVTADSTLEPHRLAELLRSGFFSPSDDADADSPETQAIRFDEEALHIATRLLCSEDSALELSIAETVRRELFWLVPHNRYGGDLHHPPGRPGRPGRSRRRPNLSRTAAAAYLRRPSSHPSRQDSRAPPGDEAGCSPGARRPGCGSGRCPPRHSSRPQGNRP